MNTNNTLNIIEALFHWTLDASLRASFLVIAILLIQSVLGGRISARWRYALWLPVLLVLTLPVLPQSRFSAENVLAVRMHASPVQVLSLAPIMETATNAGTLPVTKTSPLTRAASLDWKEAAGIIWAAGASLTLAAGFVFYTKTLRRFMRKATMPGDPLMDTINTLSAEIRLRRSPQVILSSAVESPAVTGLLRPVLLLPADFMTIFTGKEALLVLKHELMHLKRLDLQVNTLVCILNALHWFNPLVWLAAWRVRQDREAACDAQVLASGPDDCRSDYGHALLKVQSAHSARGLSLGFVGIFEPGRVLRSRIEAIARYRRSSTAGGMVAGVVIILLGMLGATHAQTNQPAAPVATGSQTIQCTVPAATTDEEAAATRSKENIQKKLDHIIVPKLDFNNATLPEIVGLLEQKSRELDTTETDPSKRGVKIHLGLEAAPAGHGTAAAPALPVDVSSDARITLALTNTSLSKALHYVAELAGMKIQITPDAVELAPLSGNTAVPVATTGAETAAARDNESIQKKLDRIILPKVDFQDASLSEIVSLLEQKSRELDITEADPSKRGVAIHLKLEAASAGHGTPVTPDDARITLSLANTSLSEVLRYVANLSGMKVKITPDAVNLAPLSGNEDTVHPPHPALAAISSGSVAPQQQGDVAKSSPGAETEAARELSKQGNLKSERWTEGRGGRDQGDFDGAMADYARAIELDPKCFNAYLNRGILKMNHHDLDGAIADYTRAIELDPKSFSGYNDRAVAKKFKGDEAGSAADYARARELNLATNDEAMARYNHVIELDPKNADVYRSRGVLKITRWIQGGRRDKGGFEGGTADLTRAIELDPNDNRAYFSRGFAKENHGDLDGAIADYSRAIEINPKSPDAYQGRASARKANGDQDGSAADSGRAKELWYPN